MFFFKKISRFLYSNIYVLVCWIMWIKLNSSHFVISELDLTTMLGLATVIFLAMTGCIFTVNHYAEQIKDLIEEPFGTLLLTLSVAAIEVSLMLVVIFHGNNNPTMLRDTVYATLMIMLNGMVGLSLVTGGYHHFEQTFNLRGSLSFLHLIAPLVLILLVMPNSTITTNGPTLSPAQEIFMGCLCILVYMIFLLMQTTRHKVLFVYNQNQDDLQNASIHKHTATPAKLQTQRITIAALGLIVSVIPIVLLAEYLGDVMNYGIEKLKAPTELPAFIIAFLVLAPEGLSAYRASKANQMQQAMNTCLGSALSTIALTVPCVLLVAGLQNIDLTLGVFAGQTTLLYATLLTTLITLSSAQTTMLQGNVHLMVFLSYIFFIFYP